MTHDQEEALTLSDRIAVFNDGPDRAGRHRGRSSTTARATLFVAEFIGESNRFAGRAHATGPSWSVSCEDFNLLASAAADVADGQGAVLIVRPEHVRVEQLQVLNGTVHNHLTGTVADVLFLGSSRKVEVALPTGQRVLAREAAGDWTRVAPGDEVAVVFGGENCRLLPETDEAAAGVAALQEFELLTIEGFEYEQHAVGDATYQVAVGGDGPALVLLHGVPADPLLLGAGRARPGEHAPRDPARPARIRGDDGAPGRAVRRGLLQTRDGRRHRRARRRARRGHLLDRRPRPRRAGGVPRRARPPRHGRAARRPQHRPDGRAVRARQPRQRARLWPWFLLAQPSPFPERLIAGATEHYVGSIIRDWAALPERIPADALQRYVDAFTDETIAATCADYRASFYLDRQLDAEDRAAGRRIACPTLVLWGDLDEGFGADEEVEPAPADGPLEVWRRWADQVEGQGLACGHFIPEEAPDELVDVLRRWL